MKMHAVGCTVILKEVKIQDRSKSGLLLSISEDHVKFKTYQVVSVGPEVYHKYSDVVSVGDVVVLDKFQGTEVSLSPLEKYVAVVPSQLLCKIEGAEIDN